MNGDLPWPIVFIPVLLAGMAAFLYWFFWGRERWRKARATRMRRLAEKLGMRYYGSAGAAAFEQLPRFHLFGKSPSRTVENLVGDAGRPPEHLLLDCEFRRPRSRSVKGLPPALYLVVALRVDVELPDCRIYRKDLLGGPVGVRGLYRLPFPEDEGFTRRYLFAGGSRERVRTLMTEDFRQTLQSWRRRGPKPVVEVAGNWLAVYMESDPSDRRLVQNAEHLWNYAVRIRDALTSEATSHGDGR